MEESSVVEAFASEFEKVVAMQRSIIREGDTNIANARFNANDVPLLLFLGTDRKGSEAKESNENK